jgi:hypothetical protein
MREHVHLASRRRDERLALIRKITLWVSGGAAAASLGLGVAFAHAIPGHAASTTGAPRPAATPSAPASAGSASSAPATSTTSQPAQLAPPAQQPTQTTAPPVVHSGGS